MASLIKFFIETEATQTFLENTILIKEFRDMNLDLARMLKEEAFRTFKKYY